MAIRFLGLRIFAVYDLSSSSASFLAAFLKPNDLVVLNLALLGYIWLPSLQCVEA